MATGFVNVSGQRIFAYIKRLGLYFYFSGTINPSPSMHLPRYNYKTNNSFLDYQFTSEGPRGSIEKVVRVSEISANVYNLAFGDLEEETGEISDAAVTNNNDSRKVLATVAAIVHDFTLRYPGAWIIAKGRTHSRTRLYRMGITNNWQEITNEFEVYGLVNEDWELFEAGTDYEAFLVRRK